MKRRRPPHDGCSARHGDTPCKETVHVVVTLHGDPEPRKLCARHGAEHDEAGLLATARRLG